MTIHLQSLEHATSSAAGPVDAPHGTSPASEQAEVPKVNLGGYRPSGAEIKSRFRDVPPVYMGAVRLLKWNNNHASGMQMSLELLEVDEDDKHPFKGLRAARGSKTEGQRMFLVLNRRDPEDVSVILETVYIGEAVLMWWAEDCAEGFKVTLKLDDGPDGANRIHPCEGMATGRKGGEMLSVVGWAIDEAEAPAPAPRRKTPFSEMPATQQAHILCNRDEFFHYLVRNEETLVTDALGREDLQPLKMSDRKKYCECVIKMHCRIESRAEFKGDTPEAERARKAWSDLRDAYEDARWRRRG
jgi:hypothetical protein